MQLSCRECQMYSDVDCDAKAGYLGVCLPCWEWSNDRVLKGAQPRTGNLMRWVWQEATRLHAALCQLYGHALWITFQVSSEWTTFWLVMQNVPAGLVWSTIVVGSFSFIFPIFASLVSEAKCNRKDLKRYSAFLIWQQSKRVNLLTIHTFYIIRCLIDNN